ncbi:MAG: hypothetical protein CW716_02760 [Candidatus Bathyarchaeum sp.]|nr:MAG: hypothetical protein CW716_02760 [Candidatus Bathyarchaeum sp.]
MKNKKTSKISMITLITILTVSALLTSFPAISAQQTIQTYPYLGVIPNPVQVNQPVLFHIGISHQRTNVNEGWEGLWITITDPEGIESTITDIRTDSTGGTGVPFTPTKLGTYECVGHFPETAISVTPMFGGDPYDQVYLASDTEIIELVVNNDPAQYYPGHAQPTEYWTRPINAQFYEWGEISGDWLWPAGSYTMPPRAKYHAGNADAPEAAHVLWTKPYTQGGLASYDLGKVQYEMGDAYELKFMGSVIMSGVLYYNRYEDQGSDPELDQDVVAVDLKTGEELWVKNWNNERLAFGQTFYWDSYNYHGVFGYLWTDSGASGFGTAGTGTWKAYDPLSGRWEYTMENVPGGYNLYGPKGEIYRYIVDTNQGTVSLWNSSRVVSNAGSWRPQGNTYDATTGIEWTVPIPTDLSGSVCSYHLFDKIVGSTAGGIFGGTSPEITNWAIDVSPGNEGTLIFQTTETLEVAGMTLVYSETIPENDVLIISAKEDRRYYAFSLTDGSLKWVTEPENYIGAFYDKWYGPAYGYGKFFTGRVSGVVTCYDLENGSVLWNYDVQDKYNEITWGHNFHIAYHFLADGKICLSYSEHSPINPIPRGGPLVVLDVENGTVLWELSWINNWWGGHVMIGDSTMVGLNGYDNRLYAIGKGPSQTTVEAPLTALKQGESVIIRGTVTDVSPGTEQYALTARFPNGVPAVADECMTDWMQYVYMQYEKPDVEGVKVFVKVQDPNGEWYSETVTTDSNGMFSMMWAPSIVGEYHVTAMFEGSKSYYPSESTTSFGVDQAAEDPGYQGPSADDIATRTVNMMPQFPDVPTQEAIAHDAATRTIAMLPQYPECDPCPELPAYLMIDIVIIVLVVVVLIIVLYCIIKKQ